MAALFVCDVGPRDGLQNNALILSADARAELCRRLAAAGVRRVEAVSFVDPFPDGPCEGEFELTPLLKRAFELVKLEGLTCAEAGREMGKTEGTVRTYVWKARQIMRGALA